MQVFRELYIRGEPDQLAATVDGITASLSGGWSRDPDLEQRLQHQISAQRAYCFQCEKQGRRRAATLFLTEKDPTTYSVVNIVPDEDPRLSYFDYNCILEEFFRLFVEPAAARTGASAELTDADADLERWMTPQTADKLRAFCQVANKRTGARHPVDRERWFDFIVAAHREGSELTSSTLARWLQEVGGWDADRSDELAIEYERARKLLVQADAQPVGA